MRWFVNRPWDNGCVYYRQTLPLRHLMPRLAAQGVRVRYSGVLDLGEEYDAYFFSRWIDEAYLPVLVELKRRGKIIVWDMDDDLLGLERHDEKDRQRVALRIRGLELCLDMADLVTVSTEGLKARVERPEKTVVVPNLIDLADHPVQLPVVSGKLPERTSHPRFTGNRELTTGNYGDTILYTGSPSHRFDVELIRDLHDRTQRDFRWVFYGIRPDWLTARDLWIPWSRVSDYPKVCRLVRPWVSLCPLTPERFNESKSAIKVWECATLGGNVLASDTGPYRGHPAAIVREGAPFELADLAALWARPNHAECLEVARENSWQHSASGPWRWMNAYLHVASLVLGQ